MSTDEEGIDLSQVPVCVTCGLETADRVAHRLWHTQQNDIILALQQKVAELERLIHIQVNNQPHKPLWDPHPMYISEEEIRKYSQNPGKHPPPYKSGDPWDKQ